MYRCILAPLDGTEAGECALPLAARIAQRSGAVLHLVHVQLPFAVPPGVDAGALGLLGDSITTAPAPDYLEKLGRHLQSTCGISVVETFLQGPVAPTLEKYAADCGMSLVVMSRQAHAHFGRVWHEGVAEQVTRSLQIPVLFTRTGDENSSDSDPSRDLHHFLLPLDGGEHWADIVEHAVMPSRDLHHFLLPLDGGEHWADIVEHAVMLGGLFDARYTLIRVVEHATGEHSAPSAYEEARSYLETIASRLRSQGLEVNVRIVFAERPAEAIMAAVEANDGSGFPIDCIAMESRSQTTLSNLLGFHTLDSVIRGSPMNMLLWESKSETVQQSVDVPGLQPERSRYKGPLSPS